MPAHNNPGLEALTRDAFEDLRLEFGIISRTPRIPQLTFYNDKTKLKRGGVLLRGYDGMAYKGKIYLNIGIAKDGLLTWGCLHTVGEEVGHCLHARVNRALERRITNADEKEDREKYREYSALQELVGYWAGCAYFKEKTGQDIVPHVKEHAAWEGADDEHYWGYYTAAHLIMAKAPLRTKDFIHCTRWEQAHDVYKQFLDFTPDFSKKPPKE